MCGAACGEAPSWRSVLAFWFVAVALLAIGGCARPRDENLKAFATATSALSNAAKTAGGLNTEIDGKIKLTEAADEFADGGVTRHPHFPAPEPQFVAGKKLTVADWKVIEAFLAAVSAYADALNKANDPKLETDLTDKTTALANTIAKAATAQDVARGNPNATKDLQRLQFIGGIAVDIVSIASNIYAGYQIQQAMDDVQPQLDAARAPLTDAINAVVVDDKAKYNLYVKTAQDKLKLVSKDPTFIAKYDAYVALNQDVETLNARVAALDSLSKAVGAMIDAHAKLKDNLDSKTALLQFLQTVGDIVDKVQKIEALQKKS